jgi:hypothetical protein
MRIKHDVMLAQLGRVILDREGLDVFSLACRCGWWTFAADRDTAQRLAIAHQVDCYEP